MLKDLKKDLNQKAQPEKKRIKDQQMASGQVKIG